MDLLRSTVEIADVFESEKYDVFRNTGEFENDDGVRNDFELWKEAVKEWASGVLWKGEDLPFYEEFLAGNYALFNISEKSWKVYCEANPSVLYSWKSYCAANPPDYEEERS